MNILQLCKAAERYEILCMMNLTEDEIRNAADRYEIPFDDLYVFIQEGANESKYRGMIFAYYVSKKCSYVETVLLNSDFYEIWETTINK